MSRVGLTACDPPVPAVARLKPLIGPSAENQLVAFNFHSSRTYPKPAPPIDCRREVYGIYESHLEDPRYGHIQTGWLFVS